MFENIPEEEYTLIVEKTPLCCVDLIIVKDKKVLVVKRKNKPAQGVYWFPGGRVHKNEKLKDAVLRKARQEVGVDVEIIKNIGAFETIFPDSNFSNKTGTHSINSVFLVSPKSDHLILDEQSEDFRWIDKIEKDLPDYIQDSLKISGVFNAT